MTEPEASALVSVIVPASRQERHAEAALRSVFEQTHGSIEVIVVENEAGQDAGDEIRGYFEREEVRRRFRRAVFVPCSDALRTSHAINRGLQASHGEFVNVLEPGDVFALNRFSRLLSACVDGGAELAFSRAAPLGHMSASSPVAGPEADYVYRLQDDIELFPTVGYALLRSPCAVSAGNLFFSRRLAGCVGGFGNYDYLYGWDFVLRCLMVTEPIYVPESLYVYPLRSPETFLQRQARAAAETVPILKNYFFLCRNRPVANALAPSPAWGPFLDSFVQASQYGKYLTRP